MIGENTQSPSLVGLQLLNRRPCFQQAEQAQLQGLNTCLCRPPWKWRPRLSVTVVTGGCSTSKGWWLPSILIVTLWRGPGLPAVEGTCAGLAEAWARVPAWRPPLPRQVLQPMLSALPLLLVLVIDEPSLNYLGEPHTMLWLLSVPSLKFTLVLHRAGLKKGICCYYWYNYWSQQAGMRSLLAAFYCHSQGSQLWSQFLPTQPKPPCAHGSRAAVRADPARPAGSRPEPGTCSFLAHAALTTQPR